jgi:hypothetical protein
MTSTPHDTLSDVYTHATAGKKTQSSMDYGGTQQQKKKLVLYGLLLFVTPLIEMLN